MRFSRAFIPTLKESPADAEVVSHRYMTRAGMVRKVAAGIYNLLPLGLRVVRKVESIVRSEMNASGAEEVLMPFVIPAELWKETGRWDAYGKELLRVSDRHGREFCLGPTHEEVVTDMVRSNVRSYRELPKNIYQIQTKFRDEIRPRFGLMRGREFIMKDAYSFHASDECAEREYRNMHDTYCRIFERCGLSFRAVEAETGAIGGRSSHEFMVLADTGEDAIASCGACSYAANVERAEIRRPDDAGSASKTCASHAIKNGRPEGVATPGKKTVDEVSAFLKVAPSRLIKTLIFETDKGVVAALVRGDHDLNEEKLKRVMDSAYARLAGDEAVRKATGAPSGFAGPVGLRLKIYADYSVRDIVDGVAGANAADRHLINVCAPRDFDAVYADLRVARAGDLCPRCKGALDIKRGIEVGHIFKLGANYSEKMGATFLDERGHAMPMIMGCYGIGIGRTVAASIEQNHDEAGIIWPMPLSPFDCVVVPVNVKDAGVYGAAERIYNGLKEAGLDALIDDRDERAGVKFKDADLIGAPIRVAIGEKNLKDGNVEIKARKTGKIALVKTDEAVNEALRMRLAS